MAILKICVLERAIYGAPEEIEKLSIDGYLLMEVATRNAYTAADIAAMMEDQTIRRYILRVTIEAIES